MPRLVRLSKWFFFVYIAFAVLLIVLQFTLPDQLAANAAGCHWVRTWLDEIRCQNFPGASALQFILILLIFIMVYGPMVFIAMMFNGDLFGTIWDKPELFALGTISAAAFVLAAIWPTWLVRKLIRTPHK